MQVTRVISKLTTDLSMLKIRAGELNDNDFLLLFSLLFLSEHASRKTERNPSVVSQYEIKNCLFRKNKAWLA